MDRRPHLMRQTWFSLFLATLAGLTLAAGAAAQTNPTAQSLPYSQNFTALAHTSTAYPAGLQGWTAGTAASGSFRITTTGDNALAASSSASTTAGGIHNYNGKIGILTSGSNDGAIALAVVTTGLSGISVSYDIMTIRNPYDGTTNTRISEATLQYRVGTTGDFATLTGIGYSNNTTTQTGAGVTTPQNSQSRSVTLPPACDNQPVVQVRWVCRDVSGAGSRPSVAVDNISVTSGNAPATAFGLQFDGVNDNVTFGQALGLSASNFTVETWFMRTGAGVVTSTGSGGSAALGLINVVPLVTKGRGEGDGGTIDCNYFLGIQNTPSVVLAADYEHDATANNNHALVGTTVIQNNTWYHAALTYDGATLRIYLNGVLEASAAASPAPRSDLAQHAGLGTAMTSSGAAAGFFAGMMDEARIWNYARNQCDIVASMNQEVTSGTGLLGRWGLNDGSGTTALNSIGGSPNGTLLPAGNAPLWVTGSPFNAAPPSLTPPAAPVLTLTSPVDGVQIELTWTNVANEDSYEIERSTSGAGGPWSLLATRTANTTSYIDAPLSPSTEYCYRVRATNCQGSGTSTAACATTMADLCNALDFAGAAGHVTFGSPASLQLSALTIEMWMRRDGPGTGTDTGTGGIPDLIPLVAKGRAEAEVPAQDIN